MHSNNHEVPAAEDVNHSKAAISPSARPIGEGSTIAAFVAARREPLRVDALQPGDPRFPEGLSGASTGVARVDMSASESGSRSGGLKIALAEVRLGVGAVLAYPVVVDKTLVGVLVAYRFAGRLPFTLHHERVGTHKSFEWF